MQHTTNTAPAFNAGLAYSEFQQRKAAYIIAAITAFLMSAYFVVGYFAGHLRIWEWDGSQWAQAVPSIGLVGVMTAYQFFLYSQGDVAGGKKATYIAVFVAVAFSLLSEIGQGMERDNIRMETKSQQSPTYLATLEAIKGATGASYNPYAADLQTAQMKLAQCQQRMAQGKEKHCEGSKARVDAVNQMIATSNASSQQRALALAGTAKTMEKDETNYHPLVNFIRETLGATGTIASFMLSLTLISFFEYAFHYLGGQFAKARAHLMNHGYDVTRKLRQPPRRFDGSITTYHASNTGNPASTTTAHNAPPVADLMEMRESGKIEHFKDRLQDAFQPEPEPEKKGGDFGFIRQGQAAPSSARLDAENRAKYPQEIIMPMTKRPTPHDYGAVPRKDLQNALQTSVVTDTTNLQTSVLQTSVDAYSKAESAAAGTVINCPNCGKPFRKVNRFHIFCSHSRKKREDGGNCSDEWHNSQDPARLEALKAKSRRRKV